MRRWETFLALAWVAAMLCVSGLAYRAHQWEDLAHRSAEVTGQATRALYEASAERDSLRAVLDAQAADRRKGETVDKLVAQMDAQTTSSASGILSALVTLVRAGLVVEYGWARPDSGTTPVRYEAEVWATVPDTTLFVLLAQKSVITVRARAVDAAGRAGLWSEASDTLRTSSR